MSETKGVHVRKIELRYPKPVYGYIKALGGELKLVALFTESDIPVQLFESQADRRLPSGV